jgi:SAM-dependent methyltransferase
MMSSGIPEKIDPNQKPHLLYEGIEYKDFWRESDNRSRLDELEREIIRDLLPLSGTRIIDLGCGYGRLADCYFDRFRQIILFDASISLLRQAQETTNGRGWFLAGDINHLPFREGSFDQVLMIRVFHHLPDSRSCLSEVSRILSRDSTFIFSYSNKRNLARIAAYLLGKDPNNPFSMDTFGMDTTLIRHHPRYVDGLLVDSGFRELKHRGAGVIDKLTNKKGPFQFWLTLGKFFAPLLGKSKLAPWVICRGTSSSEKSLLETDKLIDLLQCPSCGSHLVDEGEIFLCAGCGDRFSVKDGIVDFRPK